MKKNNVIRQVFVEGKSSSRPQHLEFNRRWFLMLCFTCPAAAIAMFASSIYHGGELMMFWELFLVPPLFRFHELWATMDNDEAYKVKGFRGFYWNLYSRKFKHRSVFSHSLIFGAPLRFCIGYWWIILGFVLLWNYQLVLQMGQGAIDVQSALWLMEFPMFAARFIAFWYGAAILADICHLLLDKYNPVQWVIGKK